MTTYVQTPVEPSEADYVPEHVAHEAVHEEPREQMRFMAARRRPRRGALVFVTGFILGAFTSAVAGIFSRGRQPLVLGNRNLFLSLPFSGVSLSSASIRSKGRRPRGLAALRNTSRRRARAR